MDKSPDLNIYPTLYNTCLHHIITYVISLWMYYTEYHYYFIYNKHIGTLFIHNIFINIYDSNYMKVCPE